MTKRELGAAFESIPDSDIRSTGTSRSRELLHGGGLDGEVGKPAMPAGAARRLALERQRGECQGCGEPLKGKHGQIYDALTYFVWCRACYAMRGDYIVQCETHTTKRGQRYPAGVLQIGLGFPWAAASTRRRFFVRATMRLGMDESAARLATKFNAERKRDGDG